MKKESKIKSNKTIYIIVLILVIGLIGSISAIVFVNKSKKELINNVNIYLENEFTDEEEYMIMEWNDTRHLVKEESGGYKEIYEFNSNDLFCSLWSHI